MIHVAAVVVGAIIGVGIFFSPAQLAKALPSPAWILGVWVLGGVASVACAFVYAELGGRYPKAGGVYVFLREGFGPRAGPFLAFEYAWTQLLVVQPGSTAIIALVLVDHVAFLTGPLSPAVRMGSAMGAITLFTLANLLGLRTGGRIQVASAAMKLSALIVLILVGIVWGHADRIVTPSSTPATGSWPSLLLVGLIPVLFSFGGAYHGTFIAGSVKNPERAVPRGIILGISVVLIGYLGINVAYLGVLGHDGLAASASPAASAAARALGEGAGVALAVTIVLSAAGILNTISLGFPFVVYAMARDRLFFAFAGKLDSRTGRPAAAVALQGLMACIAVALSSSVDVLLVGIAFADATFQAAVAIVHLRVRKTPLPAGVLRAPLIAPVANLLLNVAIAGGSLIAKPLESALGAAVLVVGVVVYMLWRAAAQPGPV